MNLIRDSDMPFSSIGLQSVDSLDITVIKSWIVGHLVRHASSDLPPVPS